MPPCSPLVRETKLLTMLEWDSDDVLISVFARVPFLSHGSLRATCRRARGLLASLAFRQERLESRFAAESSRCRPRAGGA